ncbi:MAG: tRNA 2-thiocytidine biosynthesis TtcA family protein [Eubacteriales bacterium]
MEFEKIRRLLSRVRSAVDRYGMIEEGDRIAVGISGGKDSLALLAALAAMRRFYPKSYEVCGISVDMGFEGSDFSAISDFCREIGVEYRVVPTELAKIIFDIRKESNPCSLCSKMRRGILHQAAKEMGCNKLALGHHYDDVLDTFLMNLFNEGRLGTFSPVTYLDRRDITVIRPLVLTPEKDVLYFVRHNAIPVMKSPCPEDKHTDREKIKTLLNNLDRENDGLKHRIFKAIEKSGLDGYKEK